MNSGFFETYDRCKYNLQHPYFSLEHTNVVDWFLEIGERDGIGSGATNKVILRLQACDLDYVLAQGECILKDWLIANKGGY